MFPRGGEFHAIILFLNSNDYAHARMQVPRALAHLWEIMVDLERPHEEALKRFCFSSLDYYDTRHFRQGIHRELPTQFTLDQKKHFPYL